MNNLTKQLQEAQGRPGADPDVAIKYTGVDEHARRKHRPHTSRTISTSTTSTTSTSTTSRSSNIHPEVLHTPWVPQPVSGSPDLIAGQ